MQGRAGSCTGLRLRVADLVFHPHHPGSSKQSACLSSWSFFDLANHGSDKREGRRREVRIAVEEIKSFDCPVEADL
jgi:hypothetical protein